MSTMGRIDTHHHVVPPFYKKALETGKGDPSGSWTPTWTLDSDAAFSDTVGIGVTIFSLTAPGTDTLEGQAAVHLARQTNEYLASLRDADPARYGFFAAMPPLTNTAAALEEIAYALDVLRADGVTLFTRYGDGQHLYLGNETFIPIWKALDERGAVVFIHPTHAVDTTLIAKNIPQPIADYPHETTRAAVSLIAANTLKEHASRCKIILSHAGGTLPYLANRISCLHDVGMSEKTHDEILAEIGSFYFDLALSSSKEVVQLLLTYTSPDHLLFGSDYPYAPPKLVTRFANMLDQAGLEEGLLKRINSENALKLFPRLKKE